MKEVLPVLLILALLYPIFVSCTPAASPAGPTPPSKGTPAGEGPGDSAPPANTPRGVPPAVPPEAEQPVKLAVEDLSRRTGVPAEQIQVQSVEEVEWRDSSLGCPEPGKAYAQVITPGYRITLEAQQKTYEYHSDQGRRVVLCEKRR